MGPDNHTRRRHDHGAGGAAPTVTGRGRLAAMLVAVALAAGAPAGAVTPPDHVNYQGVLRDASGNPRDGAFDMTFRFFDAAVGGNEILVDRHLAAGTGAVMVSGGLFDVRLGSGAVSDGAAVLAGDPYLALAGVFHDFGSVWLQIEIGAEVLAPRIEVASVPYALQSSSAVSAGQASFATNASLLDGIGPAGYLNTSATAQTKAGSLAVATLNVTGNSVLFGSGSRIDSTPTGLFFQAGGGFDETDLVMITAGNSLDDGSIRIDGTGAFFLHSGNGSFLFLDDYLVKADLNSAGDFRAVGDLITSDEVRFPFGASAFGDATGLHLRGGTTATTDLELNAGNSIAAGSIRIDGSGPIELRSGNGLTRFLNGVTGAQTMSIDPSGDLQVAGDVIVDGPTIELGPTGFISATAASMTMSPGGADTADLLLQAGNDSTDGSIEILGDSEIRLRSGNGAFNFLNGTSGSSVASISSGGVLTAANSVAAGSELRFTVPGPRLSASVGGLNILAGDEDDDDLFLRAGNDFNDGGIDIIGGGATFFRSGNGNFNFIVPGGTLATINPSGTFTATADLVAQGDDLRFGSNLTGRVYRDSSFDDIVIARDEDANSIAWFRVYTDGGTIEQMRIEDGDNAAAYFNGNVNANGLDYAEAFRISDTTLEPGEVVVFDPARPGFIARSTEPYSTLLAGVISERPGFVTGSSFDAEKAADPVLARDMRASHAAGHYQAAREMALLLARKKDEQQRPVALAGRLPVKVDARYGSIQAGDHLTSSPTPGHAMAMQEAGPSIGVALDAFSGPGQGVILAFVQRGHYTPASLIAETLASQEQLARSLSTRTPDPASGVQVMPSDLQVVLDASAEEESRFSIFRDGQAAAPRSEVFRVDERGNVWAQGAFRPRSMDVAEAFAVSEPVAPGDVLVVDRRNPGRYARSREAGDQAVVGVVAADPGVLLGGDVSRLLGESPDLAEGLAAARAALDRKAEQTVWAEVERRFQASHAPVAMSGTVMVKVDAAYGAIEAGDLLVASPTPGHAMRAAVPAPQGAVIGKALELIDGGVGSIRMVVMLR